MNWLLSMLGLGGGGPGDESKQLAQMGGQQIMGETTSFADTGPTTTGSQQVQQSGSGMQDLAGVFDVEKPVAGHVNINANALLSLIQKKFGGSNTNTGPS